MKRLHFWHSSALVAATCVLAAAAAECETVYDTFTTKWRPIQIGTGTTSALVRNRLEISLEADAQGDGRDFIGRGLISTCAISGNFDLRANFRLLDWPDHNGVRVALFLGSLADIENSGIYLERDSYSEADVEGGDPIDVYVFYADEGLTYVEHETTQESGLFRLRRIGPIVTGYYRSDLSWVEIGSTDAGTQDLQFSVVAYTHDSVFADAEVRVAFDRVRLVVGSLTGPACPLATS